MIAAALAGLLAWLQEPPDAEPADLFAWARRLDDLDLSWSWGDFEFELSGALTLEAFLFNDETSGISLEQAPLRQEKSGFPTDTAYKRTRVEDGPEAGGRLQLFLDGFYREWLAYFVEARVDHGAPFREHAAIGARLEQYWLRVSVPDHPALHFQAGKFSAPIGNFLPRHAPRENPLTTFPLPYDQVTTFMYKLDTAAVVLGRRDRPDVKDWRVPIWQEVYGTGAMGFGKTGAFSYAVAVMNSAPGTWAFDWDYHSGDFKDPNVYLRGQYAFGPGAKVGTTWSRGPYDREDADGIPSGRDSGDFPQTLAGVDVEFSRGDLDVFAEVYWTRFAAPFIDDLELWSWYAEAKYTFLPGLFGAARLAQMIFGEIEDATGESRQWDRNVSRVEVGGGYFFTRNFFVKATGQLNYTMGGREPNDHLLMLQVGLTF
jgi:hypothetical protein